MQGRKTKKRKDYGERGYKPTNDENKPRKKRVIEGNNKNIIATRCDTNKEVEHNGKKEPLKIAVYYRTNKIYGFNTPEKQILSDITNKSINATNRPIHKVIQESVNKSPRAIETPGKDILYLDASNGAMDIFSNRRKSPNIIPEKDDLHIHKDFMQSESYKSVKKPNPIHKSQTVIITAELLKKSKKEIAKNFGVRKISQNKIMVEDGVNAKFAGAPAYGEASGLLSKVLKPEWLHLIAHRVLGTESQIDVNVVGGSHAANTHMMMVEAMLGKISKVYPEGFELTVSADLFENTHIAHTISFIIKTEDFTVPFKFYALEENKPHYNNLDYVSNLIDALLAKKLNKSIKTGKSSIKKNLFSVNSNKENLHNENSDKKTKKSL